MLEVTSGHRVTLTYNLYFFPIGPLARPVADPTKLPLYETLKGMLLDGDFMTEGIQCFGCSNVFLELNIDRRRHARLLLPSQIRSCHRHRPQSHPCSLQRGRSAIFSAFYALGIKTGVHPIVPNLSDEEGHWRYNRNENDWGGLSAQELKNLANDVELDDKLQGLDDEKSYEEDNRWHYDDEEGSSDDDETAKETRSFVGDELHGPLFANYENEDIPKVPRAQCATLIFLLANFRTDSISPTTGHTRRCRKLSG